VAASRRFVDKNHALNYPSTTGWQLYKKQISEHFGVPSSPPLQIHSLGGATYDPDNLFDQNINIAPAT